MSIVKSREDSALLVRRDTKTIENETKEQQNGFTGTLLDTLCGRLLGNISQGKKVIRAGATQAV